MLGGPTMQISRVPRHQTGLPTGMTDAGESPREPCVLRGAGGPSSPISHFGGAGGAAVVAPTRWSIPGVKLRRVLRVGSWNILSLSEDHRLAHLSDELSRLRVDMVGLSETRRPDSGETRSKGFTYHWSGIRNGHHVKGGSHRRLQQTAAVCCRGYSG